MPDRCRREGQAPLSGGIGGVEASGWTLRKNALPVLHVGWCDTVEWMAFAKELDRVPEAPLDSCYPGGGSYLVPRMDQEVPSGILCQGWRGGLLLLRLGCQRIAAQPLQLL